MIASPPIYSPDGRSIATSTLSVPTATELETERAQHLVPLHRFLQQNIPIINQVSSKVDSLIEILMSCTSEVHVDQFGRPISQQHMHPMYGFNPYGNVTKQEIDQALCFVERAVLCIPLARIIELRTQKVTRPVMGVQSMSAETRNLTLEQFKSGQVRCVVATSSLEEGIDVAACKVVVRFDYFASVRSHIQGSGRARHPNAKIFYFEQEPSVEQDKAKLMTLAATTDSVQIPDIPAQQRREALDKANSEFFLASDKKRNVEEAPEFRMREYPTLEVCGIGHTWGPEETNWDPVANKSQRVTNCITCKNATAVIKSRAHGQGRKKKERFYQFGGRDNEWVCKHASAEAIAAAQAENRMERVGGAEAPIVTLRPEKEAIPEDEETYEATNRNKKRSAYGMEAAAAAQRSASSSSNSGPAGAGAVPSGPPLPSSSSYGHNPPPAGGLYGHQYPAPGGGTAPGQFAGPGAMDNAGRVQGDRTLPTSGAKKELPITDRPNPRLPPPLPPALQRHRDPYMQSAPGGPLSSAVVPSSSHQQPPHTGAQHPAAYPYPVGAANTASSSHQQLNTGAPAYPYPVAGARIPAPNRAPPPPGLTTPTDSDGEVPPPPPGMPPADAADRGAGDLQYSSGADGSSQGSSSIPLSGHQGGSLPPPPPPGLPPAPAGPSAEQPDRKRADEKQRAEARKAEQDLQDLLAMEEFQAEMIQAERELSAASAKSASSSVVDREGGGSNVQMQ